MKKAIVIAALCLLLIPSTISAASDVQITKESGNGSWSDNTWRVDMFPGETKTITLRFYNSTSNSLRVWLTISSITPVNDNLTLSCNGTSFTMSRRRYADVTLTAEADGSIIPDTYTAELGIRSEVIRDDDDDDDDGDDYKPSSLRISNLIVRDITEDSADISWRTNRPATSKLAYWASPRVTIRDYSYSNSHLVHLRYLRDDTTYRFEIDCEDKYALTRSSRGTFTTLEEEIVEEPELVEPEPEKPEPQKPEPSEDMPEEMLAPATEETSYWWLVLIIILSLILITWGATYWQKRRRAR